MKEFKDLAEKKELLEEPVTDAKLELARQLFVSLESQIMLADRKVQAVFGLNAFLVATLSSQNQQSLASTLKSRLASASCLTCFLKVHFLPVLA